MAVASHLARAEPPGLRVARRAAQTRADRSLVLLDALICAGAYASVLVLRFDGGVPDAQWHRFETFLPFAVFVHLAANCLWHLYGQMWKHASVQEARRLVLAGIQSMALLVVTLATRVDRVPISVPILGGCMATMLMGAVRYQSRLFAFHRARDRHASIRVAVIGAGESGGAIIREMLRDQTGSLMPVVVLDDDPRNHGRSLLGIPIVGTVGDLPEVASRFDVHQALLAVQSVTKEEIEQAASAAAGANLPLKVLPVVSDLLRGSPSIRDVRDLRIEDLLGRAQVETDLGAVRALLTGRRVLITGAGGSIGSEIVGQVAACNPDVLVALDHDETHLYDALQGIPAAVQVLCDIKDLNALESVFRTYRPDVVFHAAAHKHVPILETHACEAAATNVLGTRNVVETAATFGVRHLVVISTDKAVRPTSVMGASKWLSEQVMLAYAPDEGRYCAVRFGNVLGSRGSVIPTFKRQIAAGGPVTVTDPRMTRFFMSIKEAVQLVLQAAALAEGRDLFMLEMGEPVSIYDLADKMIRLSGFEPGVDIGVKVTGMRPGEKLEEELRSPGETVAPTRHPSVLRLQPLPLPRAEIEAAVQGLQACIAERRDDDAASLLRVMALEPEGPRSEDASVDLLLDSGR
jgi:FlaA1/EpsC-like NDP-sugar epimerase